MLASLELDLDFSRGCALSAIKYAFLLTHPHHLTIHESTPANANRSKGEWCR